MKLSAQSVAPQGWKGSQVRAAAAALKPLCDCPGYTPFLEASAVLEASTDDEATERLQSLCGPFPGSFRAYARFARETALAAA